MNAPSAGKYPASLAEALAVFQAGAPKISKGNTAEVKNDQGRKLYDYSYADLADVNEVVLPRLGAVGLAFTSRPTLVDGQFALAYSLLHVSGEREDGVYPLQANLAPQKIGSLITYARRYSLLAVTGLAAAGDDDDASGAQAEHRQSAGDVFENAAPARPRQNAAPRSEATRPAVRAVADPDGAIDDDAQALAVEAWTCRSVAELKKIHATAQQQRKLTAFVADPATGTKGQLGPYLNFRKKALEDLDAAWQELSETAGSAQRLADLEDDFRIKTGINPEAATPVQIREFIASLDGAVA